MLNRNELNDLALELRRSWGIDDYNPINNIVSLILDKMNKLTIIWMEMDEEISGCCSKNSNKEFIILINSLHSKGRQNFTLAHELYHLIYENERDLFICSDNKKDSEKEADIFASSFLMPKLALKEYKKINKIEKWKLRDIIKCEQYFQISHVHMLFRLRKENWITYDAFEKYKENIKYSASKLDFDISLYENSYSGNKYFALGHLFTLIDKVYSENKISNGLKNEILIKNFRSDIAFNIVEESNID